MSKIFKYCFGVLCLLLILNDDAFAQSSQLNKEIATIKKLLDDGLLSEQDFEKVKKKLIEKDQERLAKLNIGKEKTKKPKIDSSEITRITVNLEPSPGRKSYEKASFTYKDYEIYTFRPGGIKVKRISDNKVLVTITDRLKVKFSNNGEKYIKIKKSGTERPTAEQELKHGAGQVKDLIKGTKDLLLNPGKVLKRVEESVKTLDLRELKSGGDVRKLIPKDSIKFSMYIEGAKILKVDGRYVGKHRAFFYQFMTTNYQPFHYYVLLQRRAPIAFNMEMFNKRVDTAVRKAKERLAKEHNITLEQIDEIIQRKVESEVDQATNEAVEQAVQDSVAQAIEETVGEAMARGLVEAIEAATGEAIDDALEAELGAAIDAEIARAVEMGIDEAAVTAGWQAYFETLAAGGTEAQAVEAAYAACGGPCENY